MPPVKGLDEREEGNSKALDMIRQHDSRKESMVCGDHSCASGKLSMEIRCRTGTVCGGEKNRERIKGHSSLFLPSGEKPLREKLTSVAEATAQQAHKVTQKYGLSTGNAHFQEANEHLVQSQGKGAHCREATPLRVCTGPSLTSFHQGSQVMLQQIIADVLIRAGHLGTPRQRWISLQHVGLRERLETKDWQRGDQANSRHKHPIAHAP